MRFHYTSVQNLGWLGLWNTKTSELSYEKIEFDIKPINQSMLDVVKKLTISGIGEVERVDVKNDQGLITESKKVVKDLKINYLFAAIS